MPWLLIYDITGWLIGITMVLVVLRQHLRPATALAWLSVVFLVPIPGSLAYLLFGSINLGKRRVRLYHKVLARFQRGTRLAGHQIHVLRPDIEPAHLPVILQAERISGMPIFGGNEVELLADSDEMIRRLIADIDAARHHVHLLYYIYGDDDVGRRVADAVIRATKRGVECRLLVDAAGSRGFFRRGGLASQLNDAGVKTLPALPVDLLRRRLQRMDLRNHRKLAVIDGRVAYAGSQNIVTADYGHPRAGKWIDLSARFIGPVVSQLQTVFLEDWLFDTGQLLHTPDMLPVPKSTGPIPAQTVPTGPGQDSETLLRVLVAATNAARRRIIITTPYLVPDEPTMLALTMAAERGVEVDLVMPARSDHPIVHTAAYAYYEPLLDAGVRIYLHQRGLLHSKTMTVDDSFALLGSSNLDIRSFYLNFELNVLMYGPQITKELRFAQSRYISESVPVDAAVWRRRPVWKRYTEHAAALLSPLL